MPSGIGHEMLLMIVRAKSWRLGISAEGKLQDRHSRIVELPAYGFHFRSDNAQIFRNNRQRAQTISERPEKFSARAFHPLAMHGCWFTGRDFPIGFKTAEVIKTHHVEYVE